MAPSTTISPIVESDLPVLGGFLYYSKLSLSINKLLVKGWPNEEKQRENYMGAIKSSLGDPVHECFKAVDDSTGKIAGFVVLTRKTPPKEKPVPEKPTSPDWMNADVFDAVMESTAYFGKRSDDVDHFDITYIYVTPSSRRKGVATQMLDVCRERAKAAGIPIITVVEPVGLPFLDKAGFKKIDHFDFDLAKWAMANSGYGPFRLTAMSESP